MSRPDTHIPSALTGWRILVAKDLRQELRSFSLLISMLIYAVLILIVYGVALAYVSSGFDVLQIAGGLLWALVIFTSLVGLARSFAREKENDCLEGLLLAPLDRSVIFFSKATVNCLVLLVVEIVAILLGALFLLGNVSPVASWWLLVVPVLLGTVGIAAVGTLLATITANAHGKDVLLALLFIPIAFPLLYACVAATSVLLIGSVGWAGTFWISSALAAGYDIIMIALAWLLYGYVVEA